MSDCHAFVDHSLSHLTEMYILQLSNCQLLISSSESSHLYRRLQVVTTSHLVDIAGQMIKFWGVQMANIHGHLSRRGGGICHVAYAFSSRSIPMILNSTRHYCVCGASLTQTLDLPNLSHILSDHSLNCPVKRIFFFKETRMSIYKTGAFNMGTFGSGRIL